MATLLEKDGLAQNEDFIGRVKQAIRQVAYTSLTTVVSEEQKRWARAVIGLPTGMTAQVISFVLGNAVVVDEYFAQTPKPEAERDNDLLFVVTQYANAQ